MTPTLADLARRLQAPLQGADAPFARLISDTRQLQPGDCFVALAGERFDGHDYLEAARAAGAVGALVSRAVAVPLAQVVVAGDTLAALQRYAQSWRRDFRGPVVGVTGSNGKTTTKQLLAAVLADLGPVLATDGNLNNHIGVPLTLARLRATHAVAVIEMGANHAGEIAELAGLAEPDIGVVTQAGDAHLEGFGSREGVARAKGELFSAVAGRHGRAIINADDAYAPLWGRLAEGAQPLRFGLSAQADVHAQSIQECDLGEGRPGLAFTLTTPAGQAPVRLPMPGRHNVLNALAAAAVAHALGLEPAAIAAGLARVQPPRGRVAWKAVSARARLIDDSYNANPTSLAAGLELLATLHGQRWAVLGGMAELGPQTTALHEQAGRLAATLGIDRLYAVGPLASAYAAGFGVQARVFETHEAAIAALKADLAALGEAAATLLVKGSRSARMERIVEALAIGGTEGMH